MKNIAKYLLILSAALVAFSACQTKEEPFLPGEAEQEGCYGVFFPVQEASGYHIYNPTQEPSVEITVARTNTNGAIEVPVIASFSQDGIFTTTPIKFADGQSETTFKVSFDKAKEGTEYSASFQIDDNQYASKYSANAKALDFSFMRVEMKQFMTEDGSAVANITCTDDVFWGEVHGKMTIQYYEVDGIRYCETLGGELISPSDGTVGVGPWGTGQQLKFKWHTNKVVEVDGVEYQWIEVEPTYMGYDSANGPVYMGDYFHMRADMGLSNGNYTSSYERYTKAGDGYLPSYYDGHGGFIFNSAYWIHGTTSWYGYKDNCPLTIAEGYLRVDYSFKVEGDYSYSGVSPVYITAGADVDHVKYEVYEGALNAVQVEAKAGEIDANKNAKTLTAEDLVLDEEDNKRYADLELAPEATGTYTFIALAYSKDNKLQNSASLTFKHIAAGDVEEHAVDINVFTEDTPERYFTHNPYDSFAYCIYGSDLTDVHVGIFEEAVLAKYGSAYVLNVVKSDSDYAVSAEDLAKINAEGGLYEVAGSLKAKTMYYVLVWATNGDMDNFTYDIYQTAALPYVWNELGKGTLTDGFLLPLFGMDDVTVACDVYEEQNNPGLYKVTGFQLELAAAFYECEQEELIPYEGEDGNWWNADILVDATDPNAVYIGEQSYGIYVNSTYGYVLIDSEPTGTLADGVITFPEKEMYVGMTGNGKWYYGNSGGTFKITLPSAASAPALTAAPKGNTPKTNFVMLPEAQVWNKPVVVYERDAKPVQNVTVVVTGHNGRPTTSLRNSPTYKVL